MGRGKNTSVVLNLKKENADIVNHKYQFPFPCNLRFFYILSKLCFISVMVTKLATHQSAAVS